MWLTETRQFMTHSERSMTPTKSSAANLGDFEEELLASLLEELTEAMRRDQRPDLEGLASRHPKLAADLRLALGNRLDC